MTHACTKIEAGHYEYRGHAIYNNPDAEGPNGTRSYWSISDQEDHGSAHRENPFLATKAACKRWLDAFIDGKDAEGCTRREIERAYWGT